MGAFLFFPLQKLFPLRICDCPRRTEVFRIQGSMMEVFRIQEIQAPMTSVSGSKRTHYPKQKREILKNKYPSKNNGIYIDIAKLF